MKHIQLLISPSKIVAIAALTSVLASCGGGGSSSPAGNSSPTTITSIDPVGIVASASSQPLSILGTNFASGMTVSVTDKNDTPIYTIGTPVISTDRTVITVNVNTTATVPTDNYVNVIVKSSSGTTLATAVLGVAGASRTIAQHVQSIFDAHCIACHDGTAPSYLDLRSSASAAGLINELSTLCSTKLRVTPGDPRRTSSVLIDKISGGSPACGNPMPMPLGSQPLSATDIQTIIDWVAGGVN